MHFEKKFICAKHLLNFICKNSFVFFYKPSCNYTVALSTNKFLSSENISHCLNEIRALGPSYGFHSNYFANLSREKIIVEFSSPNIAKLFHAGHYRSTVIGNAISNILKAAGHDVTKMNYLGDWGYQFALLGVSYRKYGDEKLLKEHPLQHLFDLYVKISNEVETNSTISEEARSDFLCMENNDPDSLKFWKICKNLSIQEYSKRYAEIGIVFDVYSGEAEYVSPAKSLIQQMKANNMLYSDDNCLKIDLSASDWLQDVNDKLKSPVLARSNGTTLYLTRDVVAAIERHKQYDFDRMIYVTDKSQENHFKQLFAILEQLNYSWAQKNKGKLIHKKFGRIEKMQTRKGNIVFLNDILKEAYEKAHNDRHGSVNRKVDLNDFEVTKALALSGLIYHDLKSNTINNYKFNWEIALGSKGSSGMYLQYTYSRLCSLERNTGVRLTCDINTNYILSEPLLLDLIYHVQEYTNVTVKLYETLEPSVLVNYLYNLCKLAAKAFTVCIVKDAPTEVAEARLACFNSAKVVLGNGMTILGMTPLEQH